jgi:hypothetical protein
VEEAGWIRCQRLGRRDRGCRSPNLRRGGAGPSGGGEVARASTHELNLARMVEAIVEWV